MIREFLRHLSLELYRSRLTVRAYEADLRGFNDFLIKSGVPTGDTGFFVPSAISAPDVREWLASLSEAGLSAVSLRRKIQSVRAYFKFLMRRGVVSSNPAEAVALPKKGRPLPRVVSHEEVEKSLGEAGSLLESVVLGMLYGCGLRRSELLAVDDCDINPYTRELKILGKGNKHRVIPLPERLMTAITAWQLERDRLYPRLPEPRPLLATARGRMSVSTLYNMVRRALQATATEKKSPHTLRHSFATQLLNSGADINSVKELLGHSSLGATQIYTHVAFSELSREWSKAHPRARSREDVSESDKK